MTSDSKATSESSSIEPKSEASVFSWDKFIHDGQEKLAALIDIEKGSTHSKESTDDENSLSKSNSNENSNKLEGASDLPTISYDPNTHSAISAVSDVQVEANMSKPAHSGKLSLERMKKSIKNHSRSSLVSTESEKKAETSKPKKKSKPSQPQPDPDSGNSYMDKLMDRLVTAALPTASIEPSAADWRAQQLKGQPPFSINTMSKNFRRMTARTGIAFETIYTIAEISTWKNWSLTVSVLSIYTLVILNPRFIPVAPILVVLAVLMIPSYVYRHPPDPAYIKPVNPIPAAGPPLVESATPKPVPELSREFFYNVVDTQNFMVIYIDGFDIVTGFLERFAYFNGDECTSSFIYSSLISLAIVVYFLSPYIYTYTPWRFVFIFAGWGFCGISHPRFREKFIVPLKKHLRKTRAKGMKTLDTVNRVVNSTRESIARHKKSTSGVSVITSDSISSKNSGGSDDDETVISAVVGTEPQEPVLENESSNGESSSDYESDYEDEADSIMEKYKRFWELIDNLARKEFNNIQPFERREIEIFEIQTAVKDSNSTAGHWTASVFHLSPCLPFIKNTVTVPTNTPLVTTLSDILAPKEWKFVTGSDWTLDLSFDWTERPESPFVSNTGELFVDIDEDEKWVYDKKPANIDGTDGKDIQKLFVRRRRWTRLCIRKEKVATVA